MAMASPPQATILPLGLPDLPFHLRLDSLSAFFLFLLGATGTAISLYSAGYFRSSEGTAPGLICFEYHAFLAAMALVMIADDAYLFMVAWETMALTLVLPRHHRAPDSRDPPRRIPVPADRAHRRHRDPAVLRHAAGRQRRLHVRDDAHDAPDGRVAQRSVLPCAVRLRRQGGTPAAAHLAARSAPGGAFAGVGADERRHAQDGDLRPAARDLRSADRPALVVGRGRVGAGSRHCAVRRHLRRRADGHEAAARVFVDREHRHHRRRASASRSCSSPTTSRCWPRSR